MAEQVAWIGASWHGRQRTVSAPDLTIAATCHLPPATRPPAWAALGPVPAGAQMPPYRSDTRHHSGGWAP
ncbi:hypothetical protein GCM10010433_62720 [Streptomyces pulveraceus]